MWFLLDVSFLGVCFFFCLLCLVFFLYFLCLRMRYYVISVIDNGWLLFAIWVSLSVIWRFFLFCVLHRLADCTLLHATADLDRLTDLWLTTLVYILKYVTQTTMRVSLTRQKKVAPAAAPTLTTKSHWRSSLMGFYHGIVLNNDLYWKSISLKWLSTHFVTFIYRTCVVLIDLGQIKSVKKPRFFF